MTGSADTADDEREDGHDTAREDGERDDERDGDGDAGRVVIVGAGVAGTTAATFAARHGRETLVLDGGPSLLERNAHLENFPGFPAGIDARRLLDLAREQAERAGAEFREARATAVKPGESDDDGRSRERFTVETADGDALDAAAVIAATKNGASFLAGLDAVELVDRGSKQFVATDERGRTGVPGLYAAGRLAEKPHQTVIAAGHGAEVAVTLLEDADEPFYHDWVAPEGYFTGRGREVPPGCEEIDREEHRERAREGRAVVRERLAEPHPDEPTQHPSVADEE